MPTTTTNYGWTKPTVGGDTGNWGTELNATLDSIDTQVKATDTTANAALPKTGGALTGRLDAKTGTVAIAALGSVSGNPVNLDCSAAQYLIATLGGDSTFAFTNVPNPGSAAFGLLLELTNGGAHTVTWPASVKWPSGSAPAFTVAGVDLLALITRDGGTTWRAFVLAKDLR